MFAVCFNTGGAHTFFSHKVQNNSMRLLKRKSILGEVQLEEIWLFPKVFAVIDSTVMIVF